MPPDDRPLLALVQPLFSKTLARPYLPKETGYVQEEERVSRWGDYRDTALPPPPVDDFPLHEHRWTFASVIEEASSYTGLIERSVLMLCDCGEILLRPFPLVTPSKREESAG